jgi:hypothetical protein
MAEKKQNPGFQFVLDYLEKKSDASFAEIRDAAAKKKFTIYPIVYGRAKALLGLVESRPRGTGPMAMATKAAKAKASRGSKEPAGPQSETAAAPKRRGRPPKNAQPAPAPAAAVVGGLDGLVAAVRQVEQDRDRMRTALEQIRGVLAGLV